MLCGILMLAEQAFFWLLSVSFVAAVLLAIFSGFSYILSFGNVKTMNRAKRALMTTVAGFIICFLSWLAIHSLYRVLGYQGDWWQMECGNEFADSESDWAARFYNNEIAFDDLGGRNNPIALPDLAQGMDNIPENRYFFIHGLAGQPLDNAAEQIAQLAENTRAQNKIVYAATPARDPASNEIIGSNLFNIKNLVGTKHQETVKNAKSWIVRTITDNSSSEIPLIKAGATMQVPKFSNLWPQKEIAKDKATVTMKNGVLYVEDRTVTKEDDYNSGFDYSINLADGKLDRDNPISFNISRQDISPTGMRDATLGIADLVGESAKDSNFRNKDQWDQYANLLTKNPGIDEVNPFLGRGKSDSTGIVNDYVYNTAPVPSYTIINEGQKISPDKIKKAEQELEMIAKNVIDNKLGKVDKTPPIKDMKPNLVETTPLTAEPESAESIKIYSDSTLETPELEDLISKERNFDSAVNVYRVDNYDKTKLSPIAGKITTNNILSLKERESIREMLIDIQKEMADTAEKMGGRGMNVPVDLQMCLFYKETIHPTKNSKGKEEPESFDASAKSTSSCAGLGQVCMGSSNIAVQYLKKYAPKHFKALSEKVKKDFGVDMEKTFTRYGGDEKKRDLLRRDPNLNAALSYALLNEKAQGGINGKNRPIGNIQANSKQLVSLAKMYGPGDTGKYADPKYAELVMWCYQNNAWKRISEAGQKAVEKRLSSKK